ncbi:MAG: GntR family transcriptional regulator [Hyphomicrobiales bacterium]|nr:MAG: GntR family transcriptional regulator [Hyphomicrobiales bacterium]
MEIRRADKIVEELEQMILTGEFANGERLNEIRLAEWFGVSRTPVREAFQKLEMSGLVEQIPHRGVFTRQPGPAELVEMFEAMAELEAACARLAAMRISADQLNALRKANAICQEAVSNNNSDDYYRENERFHHLIYQSSGNSYLEQEATRLYKRLRPFRRMQLQLRGRLQQSMKEHEAIVAALADGKSSQASKRLRSHVAVQGEKFHHLMANMRLVAKQRETGPLKKSANSSPK